MTRLIAAIFALSMTTGPDNGPPVKALDEHYRAVRKDILEKLNVSDLNLPKCEKSLSGAQKELVRAQANIAELKLAAERLRVNEQMLKTHITALETVLQRQPTYGEQFNRGWEQVDGPLGLAVGWGVGTLQCVGLAWVFNQQDFRR